MYQIKLSMIIDVENKDDIEALKILEHHVEYLLDLDSWKEIKSVHDVKVEEVKLNKITPKTYL